jgi:hypothetical protein
MPTVCGSMARGRMMRLTRLDECGTPVEGVCSTLVTDGFILVTDTPNYQDPEEITQPNANGALCVDDQSDPALRWLDLAIQMCVVDPDAINILTGDPVVSDDAAVANTVGYRVDGGLTGSGNFALELWSGVPGQPCDLTGFPTFGYWLFPWVRQVTWGETSVANAALILNFNARTSAGAGWGVGPYNIRRDATVPATLEPLLTAIGTEQHKHFQWTTFAPPESACGCTELVIP